MMEENLQLYAYFRKDEAKNQCVLTFKLDTTLENIGVVSEEVRSVRQCSDTVGSLLQHTVNKIQKIIEDKYKKEDSGPPAIPVALRNRKKRYKPEVCLNDLIQQKNKDFYFMVFDQKFKVLVNAPLVKEMKLPDAIFCGFTLQPSRFHTLFTKQHPCEFRWYKSEDKENWGEIANTFKYGVQEEDVGCYLKIVCVPCNEELRGPPAEAVSENRVERFGELPYCPFEDRHKYTSERLNGNSLRVVSYNILSQRYTDYDNFPYCTPQMLAVDYRKQLIAKELSGYKADIICLQEVDTSTYTSYYKHMFKNEGYHSFYHRKGDRVPEGLSVAFNTSRFKKVHDCQLVYASEIQSNKLFAYLWNVVKSHKELKDLFLRQMTSLQLTILRERTFNSLIIVGNTHLFYHPDAEHIRVLQINMATTYLSYIRKFYSKDTTNSVSVVLCGDFNSVPSSAVFSYMVNGKIDRSHPVCQKISDKLELYHEFMFESGCGKPKYTNYTHDFKDCLDYIFIERNKMKVTSVVPLPTEEQLSVHTGLPNQVYPSDHLALVANLEFL